MAKLGDIYRRVISLGIEADPRGKEGIASALEEERKAYEALSGRKRELFDVEKLDNPFADTRVLVGEAGADVKKAYCAIDVGTGEVLLVDRMNEKGSGIDLIISHHPLGKARISLYDVMVIQADIWERLGVNIAVGEALLGERIDEVRNSVRVSNAKTAVDAAQKLGICLMCVHTPADNMVYQFLTRLFEDKKPKRVSDLIDVLLDVPEFEMAARDNDGPIVVSGSEKNRCGKIMVDMTGGTEGPKRIVESLVGAGVSTIVGMHMSSGFLEEAKKHHLNVVMAGHMACDSLGFNLILDEVARLGVEIVGGAGLYRHSRLA